MQKKTVMANFESELLKRLPEYERAGLLDSESSARLSAYLKTGISGAGRPFQTALYLAGTALIALGVILYVAHNWDGLSFTARIALGFAPLGISAVLGFAALLKCGRGSPWAEGAALLNFAGAAAMTAAISQIYHIDGDIADYAAAVAALTAAIPFVFGSRLAMCAVAIMCSFSIWASEIKALFTCELALIAMFGYALLKYGKPGALNTACSYVFFALAPPVLVGIAACSNFAIGPVRIDFDLLYCAAGTFLLSMSVVMTARGLPLARNPMFWAGIFGFALSAMCFGTPASYRSVPDQFSGLEGASLLRAWNCLTLLAIAAAGTAACAATALKLRAKDAAVLAACLILPVGAFAPSLGGIAVIAANALMFAVALILFLGGFSRADRVRMNVGLILLAVQAAVKFFDPDLGIMLRSLVFGGAGALLIASNIILSKKAARYE